eukprot:5421962-Alexandrium_andersonii.AAC.1
MSTECKLASVRRAGHGTRLRDKPCKRGRTICTRARARHPRELARARTMAVNSTARHGCVLAISRTLAAERPADGR